MRRAIAQTALFLILVVVVAYPAMAEIPAVLLLENRTEGISLRLERDTIEQSPHVTELVTSTPWQSRPSRFTGIPLHYVIDRARIETDDRLVLTALNDYSIELPPEWRQHAFLAWARDGDYLMPDDKGYFWVIFDFDAIPASTVSTIQSLAIWQLYLIEGDSP